MSSPANPAPQAAHSGPAPVHEPDAMEDVVRLIPIVLPLAAAVLIFLLAFIAVVMT